MKIEKLTGTDAFLAIDLEGAPCSAGVVRAAPKVLQGGAQAMARTATYTFAIRELEVGGMSAGINTPPEGRDDAVAAFVAAIAPRAAAGELIVDAGRGVDPSSLAELAAADPRPTIRHEQVDGLSLEEHLRGLGAVVAAEAALGSLDGLVAAVEPGPDAAAVSSALAERGVGRIVDDVLAEVDVVFCGSRQGMVDGATADALQARVVVPTGPHAVSAKGLAVLNARDVVALPDFVTLAGPTFAGWPAGATDVDAIVAAATEWTAATIAEVLGHDDGPLLGACYRAEDFLRTWRDELPFGRPLA